MRGKTCGGCDSLSGDRADQSGDTEKETTPELRSEGSGGV